jgi:protoporphyrinogen oxidase
VRGFVQEDLGAKLPHLIVLGGGLAGLSAAWAALRSKRACRLTLLEKEDRPGGLARSVEVGGVTTDLGPHRIHTTIPEMRQWFREFLGPEMLEIERISHMRFRGRFLRYPPAALEMLRALGPLDAAHFALGYASARTRVLASRLGKDSFASVMEGAFGRPLCEALVFPYVRKMWKTSPDRVSADSARVRVTMGGLARVARRAFAPGREKTGEESTLQTFCYVRGGIERLARKLADEIRARGGRIACQADLWRLVLDDDRRVRRIEYRDGEGFIRSMEGDFVFASIPLPDLVEAIRRDSKTSRFMDQAAAAAAGLRFLHIMLVAIVLRRPSLSRDHWLYFPEAEPPVNRAYEPKNFDESLGPKDRTLLCVESSALPGSAEWERSDAEIASEAVAHAAETGLFRPSEVIETSVLRLERAYPLYLLDYSERLAGIWASLRTIGNLIPLGRQGLFQHNNMDHAICTGLRAARCWSEEENPAARWYDQEMESFRRFRIVD